MAKFGYTALRMTLFLASTVVAVGEGSIRFQYEITKQWDSKPTGHDPITVSLSSEKDGVLLNVEGPFFSDPPAPSGPPGQAFPKLWEYEVVEAFFLADDDKYIEVELSPYGQHLVLLLDGRRNAIKDQLPLNYTASQSGATWRGAAYLPASYFPPRVTRFNAYAIHGSGNQRVYEALYPAPEGAHDQPDFHRLQYFKPMDFERLLPGNEETALSSVWQIREPSGNGATSLAHHGFPKFYGYLICVYFILAVLVYIKRTVLKRQLY